MWVEGDMFSCGVMSDIYHISWFSQIIDVMESFSLFICCEQGLDKSLSYLQYNQSIQSKTLR